jgi:hypothetical protein
MKPLDPQMAVLKAHMYLVLLRSEAVDWEYLEEIKEEWRN